jgi:hypothetical protein
VGLAGHGEPRDSGEERVSAGDGGRDRGGHAADDGAPGDGDIGQKVTYQLVTRLAHEAARGGRWGSARMLPVILSTPPSHFQFELRMDALQEDQQVPVSSELVLQSPVLPTWN